MNRTWKPGWTVSLTLLVASALTAQDRPLTVFVYDYIGLPDATINELETSARAFMLKAGIAIEIVQCGPRGVAPALLCEQDLRRSHFLFRIVQRPSGLQAKGSPLGSSIASGRYASLYVQNIDDFAQHHAVQSGRVMAYALVHELCHLLLGSAHGPFGIMRASWGEAEAREMDQGRLTFAAAEKAVLRSAVQRD